MFPVPGRITVLNMLAISVTHVTEATNNSPNITVSNCIKLAKEMKSDFGCYFFLN